MWQRCLSFPCHCRRTDLELPWMAPLVPKYYQTWIFVSLVGVHNQIYDLYKKIKNILTFDFMYTWNLVLKVGQRQIRIEFKYKKIMKNNTFELFSFPSKKTFLTLCSVMCCAFSFVFGINSTVSWSHHTESLF